MDQFAIYGHGTAVGRAEQAEDDLLLALLAVALGLAEEDGGGAVAVGESGLWSGKLRKHANYLVDGARAINIQFAVRSVER